MHVNHLDALGLHVFPEAQLIQQMGVRYTVVAHGGVGEGQDLPSVAGVCERLGIPGW